MCESFKGHRPSNSRDTLDTRGLVELIPPSREESGPGGDAEGATRVGSRRGIPSGLGQGRTAGPGLGGQGPGLRHESSSPAGEVGGAPGEILSGSSSPLGGSGCAPSQESTGGGHPAAELLDAGHTSDAVGGSRELTRRAEVVAEGSADTARQGIAPLQTGCGQGHRGPRPGHDIPGRVIPSHPGSQQADTGNSSSGAEDGPGIALHPAGG